MHVAKEEALCLSKEQLSNVEDPKQHGRKRFGRQHTQPCAFLFSFEKRTSKVAVFGENVLAVALGVEPGKPRCAARLRTTQDTSKSEHEFLLKDGELSKVDNHDQQRQLWKPEKGGPPSSPVCRGGLT